MWRRLRCTNTWTLLVTNGLFDNVTGAATFLDTSATNYASRFYVITVPFKSPSRAG